MIYLFTFFVYNFFHSFTLFPLLLLFDASVDCRSSTKTDSKDNSLASSTLGMEHKVSDSVAEGVVLCMEEVLKKCQLGSIDQVPKAQRAFSFDVYAFTVRDLHCMIVGSVHLHVDNIFISC